jgi:hypothetical protein
MLDLGMLYFNRDRRLAAPDVLDPFIVTENPQGLGDRLIDAAGAHLDSVFNALMVDAGNSARFQSHPQRLSHSLFIRQGEGPCGAA